jgi:hypothetical protein
MMNYDDFIKLRESSDNGFLLLFGVGFMLFLLLYTHFLPFASILRGRIKLQFPQFKLIWILVLAFLLRLPIMFQWLWYDESFTAIVGSLPIDRAMTVILSDVHPPLAYLPFWLMSQIVGTVPYLLRLPSLLAGLATVWALWRLGNKWGEDVGKVAALLGALMPALIWYSVEARAYAFLVLGVLLVLIATEEKRPLILGAALGLLPLLHVYGYLYAGVLGLYALWQRRASMLILIAAAIPALLWLPFMAFQSSDVADGFWLPVPQLGAALKPLVHMQIGLGYPPGAALVAIPLIIAVSFFALAHNFKREMLLYWLPFAGVPFLAFVISYLWHPIYLPRAILPAMTILILFYARWIVTARPLAAALLYIALAIVLPYQILQFDQIRYDLESYVAECENQPIYTMSVEVAITADSYSESPISIYSEWNNLNQSLNHYAVEALGYTVKNLPSSGACIYWQDTAMVTEEQRNQRDFVVTAMGLTCERLVDNLYRVIEVCR